MSEINLYTIEEMRDLLTQRIVKMVSEVSITKGPVSSVYKTMISNLLHLVDGNLSDFPGLLLKHYPTKQFVNLQKNKGKSAPYEGMINKKIVLHQGYRSSHSTLSSNDQYTEVDTSILLYQEIRKIFNTNYLDIDEINVPCLTKQLEKNLSMIAYKFFKIFDNQTDNLSKILIVPSPSKEFNKLSLQTNIKLFNKVPLNDNFEYCLELSKGLVNAFY